MTVDHLRCTVYYRLLSLKIENINSRTGSSACACDPQNKFSFGNDEINHQTACRLIVHSIFRNILAATRAWIRVECSIARGSDDSDEQCYAVICIQ